MELIDNINKLLGHGNNMPRLKRFLSEVKQGRTPQTLWFYKEVGHTQDAKKTLLKYVHFQYTENVLNSVNPVQLAEHKPLRVEFRDNAFASDSVKINVEQLFKLLSPTTEIKTL